MTCMLNLGVAAHMTSGKVHAGSFAAGGNIITLYRSFRKLCTPRHVSHVDSKIMLIALPAIHAPQVMPRKSPLPLKCVQCQKVQQCTAPRNRT